MHSDTGRARPWYFWAVIAFVVGLLFGWLVIGWGVWPVTWRNALPQDLRAEQKYDYLTMVAESYAANGDLQLAQSRVAGWPPEDLAKSLNAVQEKYASTNASIASNVQLLASALSVSQGAGQAAAPVPTAVPAQGRAPADGTSRSSAATILTTLLWIILVIAAITFFAYLFLRWRAAQQGRPAPDIRESLRTFGRHASAEETAAQVAAQEKARPIAPAVETQPYPAYDDLDTTASASADYGRGEAPRTYPRGSFTDQPDLFDEPGAGQRDATPPQPREARLPPVVYPDHDEEPISAEPQRAPTPAPLASAVAPAASGAKLGDFVAIYETGESDYDEAFDINDPIDGLIGQCGLQLNEPVGRNRDQAVALQAWLWDSSDPDTRVKVLMSEGAYRDTALRAQQVNEHEAFAVRAGIEFELESHDLLMKGRVEKVDYADQEPGRSVFAQLQVRMQVFRKS
jgi:hypothetical protein